eukprot:gene8048-8878_t
MFSFAFFVFLVLFLLGYSWRIDRPLKGRCLWTSHAAVPPRWPAGYDVRPYDEDNPNAYLIEAVMRSANMHKRYSPKVGLESHVYTFGEFKPLSEMEWKAVLALFPGLRNATLHKLWPEDRPLESYEQAIVQGVVEEEEKEESVSDIAATSETWQLIRTVLNENSNNVSLALSKLESMDIKLPIIQQPDRPPTVLVMPLAVHALKALNLTNWAPSQRLGLVYAIKVRDLIYQLVLLAVEKSFLSSSKEVQLALTSANSLPEHLRSCSPSGLGLRLLLTERFGKQYVLSQEIEDQESAATIFKVTRNENNEG